MWNDEITGIQKYLADEDSAGRFWYSRVNMNTGEKTGKNAEVITLYDAFFPAILALSGDLKRAEKYHASWNWLWNKYGLEPMVYNYKNNSPNYPAYDLNPEIIESAYYLYHFTKDNKYYERAAKYWSDIKQYCRNEVAFASIKDVQTMEKKDYMPTFFFAETLKYLYLTFSNGKDFNLDDYVFTTEAHQFKKSSFDKEEIKIRLGI